MRVFISWSKQIGSHFAIKIKQLLESIDPTVSAFGEDVQQKIIENANQGLKSVKCS